MWVEIIFYVFILVALFIFVKVGEMEVNGKKVVSLKYRILIALIFPLLIVLFLFIGAFILFILAIVIVTFIVFYLFNRFKRIN